MTERQLQIGMFVKATAEYRLTSPTARPRTRGVIRTFHRGYLGVDWDGLKGREYLHPDFVEPLGARGENAEGGKDAT